MKRSEFLEMVLANVVYLKENAIAKEIGKLGEITHPNSRVGCILAQMTGYYNSDRAKEISQKIIYIDIAKVNEFILNNENFQLTPVTLVSLDSPRFTELYLETLTTEPIEFQIPLAAFEIFILMDGANTSDLVAFVKGRAETFVPTFN